MIPRKSLLSIAGITLGGIGIVVCVAATILIWAASLRLGRFTESLFSKIDNSLTDVGQRVGQTQERLSTARITTEEISATLRDWTKAEAVRQIALQLNAAEKTERLSTTLQQSDQWLEVAESFLGLVQERQSINDSTGAPTDMTTVDQLVVEVASFRGQLAEVIETVARIHDRIGDASQPGTLEERFAQVAPLAVRVLATLGSLDSRLQKFAVKISGAQSKLQGLKTGTLRWMMVVTIGITLLMLWMAAGQVALCRLSWAGGARTNSFQKAGPAD